MGEISAAAVKAFRQKTGLPLMDCKRALHDADGDEEKAIEMLRKAGEKLELKRAGRDTDFGRFGVYCGLDKSTGAMVELKCESAPVTHNEEFIAWPMTWPSSSRPVPELPTRTELAGSAVAQQAGPDT